MSTQNKWNPKGIQRDHRGVLRDKWGRERQTDWELFAKKRRKPGQRLGGGKVLNPLICST